MTSTFIGFLLLLFPISAPSPLERGDQEFVLIHYPLAEAIYDSVLATSTDSSTVLWRLARVCVCMADVSPENLKLDLYRQAESYADRCIQADSTKSEGYTWRAASLGNIAVFEGGKTKVRLCNQIKQDLDQSIRLNPVDDIAYSILGSFYMALGNISWVERQLAEIFLGSLPEGGYDEGESALKKAIALAPGIIRHHFELGELYLETDRPQEALEEFQVVAALPVLLASDERTQRAAAGIIKEITME